MKEIILSISASFGKRSLVQNSAKSTLLYTLLAVMLFCTQYVSAQSSYIHITSPNTSSACAHYNLTFDAYDPDEIASITIHYKEINSLSGFSSKEVYNNQNQSKPVIDSSFSVTLLTPGDGLEYIVSMTNSHGLRFDQYQIILNSEKSYPANDKARANTYKFTNVSHNCQLIPEGSAYTIFYVDECTNYAYSPDTTTVTKTGELILTVFGDNPLTPKKDGVVHGGSGRVFEAGEGFMDDLGLAVTYDSTKTIRDTVYIDNPIKDIKYYPSFDLGEGTHFGATTTPVTRKFKVTNVLCSKSYQPKIESIIWSTGDTLAFKYKIMNDTVFEVTYDGSRNAKLEFNVNYIDPLPFNQRLHSVSFLFEGFSGDYMISGEVLHQNGLPYKEIAVEGFSHPVATDMDGFFQTAELEEWSGQVYLEIPGKVLVPAKYSIANLTKDTVLNFTVRDLGHSKIKIQVYEGTLINKPLAGIPLEIEGYNQLVYTDSNGVFEDSVYKGWTGLVTAIHPDFAFNTIWFNYITQDASQKIHGIYKNNYTVSGYCYNYDSVPLTGLLVMTSLYDSAYTDINGHFSFSLPPEWNGRIYPNAKNILFKNAFEAIDSLNGNANDINFYGDEVVIFANSFLKRRFLTNTQINTNGDTEIQVSEAKAFTGYLDLHHFPDMALTGIEAFVNIEGVILSNSAIPIFDFSPYKKLSAVIAENTELEVMDLTMLDDIQVIYSKNNLILFTICVSDVNRVSQNPNFNKDDHTHWTDDCNTITNNYRYNPENYFSIFPNPVFDGELYINPKSSIENAFLKVVSLDGKTITEKEISGYSSITLEEKGMYFLLLTYKNQTIVEKIIFQ